MLTIWGRASAFNVLKAVWAAEELGVPYTRVDAGRAFGVVDTPDYRTLNPNGKVPTIDDDGFVLWESNTIVRYLCARYGKDDIYPADIKRRMDAERWMDWQATELFPSYRPAFNFFARGLTQYATPEQAERSFRDTNALLEMLDAKLAEGPYVAGAFSMGDIPVGLNVNHWMNLGRPLPGLSNVKRWYERLRARPAAQWAFSRPVALQPEQIAFVSRS